MKLARTGPTRRGAAETEAIVDGSREVRLLDALRDLMIERDSVDVTLGEVALRAQVNHGLVGYYFGSKEGLYVALLMRHSAGTLQRLRALLRMPISPSEKLRTHIGAVLKVYDDCPMLGTLLDHILKTGSPTAVAKVNAMIVLPMVSFYENLVAEGVASGEFVKTDPVLFHLLVIGACTAVHANRARLRHGYGIAQLTPTLLAKFADFATGFILGGMRDDAAAVAVGGVPSRMSPLSQTDAPSVSRGT